jgi:acid phosphatase type 7
MDARCFNRSLSRLVIGGSIPHQVRMKRLAVFLMMTCQPGPAMEHGPLVHWDRDPAMGCRVLWLEKGGAPGTEGEWELGAAGFGYGDGDDTTLLDGMQNQYDSLAIRCLVKPPTGKDAELILKVNFDDGFVAWINGKEVARRNVVEAKGRITAAGPREANAWVEISLGRADKLMGKEGAVLAMRGFNHGLDSSDFTLHASLHAKSGAREWPLVPQGAAWEYLAHAEPEEGWNTRVLGLDRHEGGTPAPVRKVSYRAGTDGPWREAEAVSRAFGKTIHRVVSAELVNLAPDSVISFRVAADGESGDFRFRTPPATARPITFVTGGDVYHKREPMDRMNRRAGMEDPLFALLGGDLAYANDISPERWFDYIDSWVAHARTPDGRLIPKVVAIGNHETLGGGYHPNDAPGPEAASLFYSLFGFPGGADATHAVDFGKWISFLMLDSGHTRSIRAQNEWLERELEARRGVPHLFVAYHRPAWGCGAKEDSVEIRSHWCPIFEKHRVSAVFEYDHHVFCRSHPIRAGVVDHEAGIPYLGAGAWSVAVRRIKPAEVAKRPWVAASGSVNHLYRIDTRADGFTATAKDIDGKVIDRYERAWKR